MNRQQSLLTKTTLHQRKSMQIARYALILALSFIVDTSARAGFLSLQQDGHQQTIAQAYAGQRSHVQVADQGIVIKLLPDDLQGDRHQRFIVQTAGGQRLLFAYNIDIAPRIDALQRGDTIAFSGEYIWNRKGGIVHWTHHDPYGRHAAGFIRFNGRVYQ